MNKNEKLKIYDKFKQRSEKEILTNKGETFSFGKKFEGITLYELDWDSSNTLEDVIIDIVESFSKELQFNIDMNDPTKSLKNFDFPVLLKKISKKLLREDILKLAEIVSEGKVTLESIKEYKVSKNQVIDIVMNGILLNNSHIKNLITLGMTLK
jgi:hypothetical protein